MRERSTDAPEHAIRHEIGHAVYHFVCANDSNAVVRADNLFKLYFGDSLKANPDMPTIGMQRLSDAAKRGAGEMIAEAFACIIGAENAFATELMDFFMWGEK